MNTRHYKGGAYYTPRQPRPGEIKLKEFVWNEAERKGAKPHTIESQIHRQRHNGVGEYAHLALRYETKRTVWVQLQAPDHPAADERQANGLGLIA